jgi:5-methylcytosine-specific restriction protein A
VSRTGFDVVVRQLILDRAGGLCERCGAEPVQQIHHRRPRSMGSTRRPETNLPANGLAVGVLCHNRIESHRTEAYENGWLVHQNHDPAQIPVNRRGLTVLLNNAGDYTPITQEGAA